MFLNKFSAGNPILDLRAMILIAFFSAPMNAWGADSESLTAPVISFHIEGLPKKEDLRAFVENLKSDTLPKFTTLHECVQKARMITDSYKTLKTFSFGQTRSGNTLAIDASPKLPPNYPYDYHLARNFASLKVSQDAALKAIEDFHQELKLPENANLPAIKARLQIIDARLDKLSREISTASIREDAFLFLVDRSDESIRRSLVESKDEINFVLSDACKDVPVASVVSFIGSDLQRSIDGISNMKSFITVARTRRRAFVDYLHQYHRYKLSSTYAEITHSELTDIQEMILSVLATGRLVEEFTLWWQGVLTRGLADSLHTKYYQYQEPLRRLRATRETAQGYYDRVDGYTDSPEAMKQTVKNQIQNAIGIIDRSIQKLLDRGWQGQLSQQVLTVEAMYKIKDKYVDGCAPKLEVFTAKVQDITTLETFTFAEQRFAEIMDTCISKGGQ